jgi:predicted amidohydrolase YtcJ
VGGAVATGQERRLGSIEPGKWADLAVLSDNPLTVDVEDLPKIKVDMTLLNGRVVYERA